MNKESLILPWFCRLFLVAVVPLCGCDTEVAKDKPVKLRMAHVYEVTAPTHAYGMALLPERLREKTD